MKQTTKFLHIVMCMVLGLSVSMTSCKDYDDDIDGLTQRVDALESSLDQLSTDFGALAYVKSVSFENGVCPSPWTRPSGAVHRSAISGSQGARRGSSGSLRAARQGDILPAPARPRKGVRDVHDSFTFGLHFAHFITIYSVLSTLIH